MQVTCSLCKYSIYVHSFQACLLWGGPCAHTNASKYSVSLHKPSPPAHFSERAFFFFSPSPDWFPSPSLSPSPIHSISLLPFHVLSSLSLSLSLSLSSLSLSLSVSLYLSLFPCPLFSPRSHCTQTRPQIDLLDWAATIADKVKHETIDSLLRGVAPRLVKYLQGISLLKVCQFEYYRIRHVKDQDFAWWTGHNWISDTCGAKERMEKLFLTPNDRLG